MSKLQGPKGQALRAVKPAPRPFGLEQPHWVFRSIYADREILYE